MGDADGSNRFDDLKQQNHKQQFQQKLKKVLANLCRTF